MPALRLRASTRFGSVPIGDPVFRAGRTCPARRGRVRDAEKPAVQQAFRVVVQWDRKTGRGVGGAHVTSGKQPRIGRSEEHTSELQSLMRISYAVFCLKKKIQKTLQTVKT